MKIAVATENEDRKSEISPNAGRSPYYIIFDKKGDIVETFANPFSRGGGGAGFGVAKMLADKGVNTVVAGKFGDNMIGALESRGVAFHEKSGVAEEEVKKLLGK